MKFSKAIMRPLTFICLILGWIGVGTAYGQEPASLLPEEEQPEPPTCVFSGMTWEGSSISGLGYFLEGNREKEAEFIEVFLPNGGRSRKYAYYGKSPLVFYRTIEVEKEEDEPVEETPELLEEDEPVEVVYQPIVSTPLNSGMKDVFLFFKKNEGEKESYQLMPIDFDPAGFPAGSYWFFSHCQYPLRLQFGLDDQALPSLGQRMIKARLDEFGDLVFRVYRKQGAVTRKVYSTIWNYNPRARLIVFMMPSPNGVIIRRITDLVKEEKALGLRPPKEDRKDDGAPREKP
jgi:hypothetical protein